MSAHAQAATAGAGPPGLMGPSNRRRVTDQVARAVLLVLTLIALVPLVLVVYYVIKQGVGSWSADFFTKDPTGNFLEDQGGFKSAILGTIYMVVLATLVTVPLGMGVALWLTEYARAGTPGNIIRYLIDVLTGVPAVIFGIFIYITLVLSHALGSGPAAWKGSLALGLLMLPIVVRSAEVVLLLVPDALREAALALGAPRWKVVTRVVLPAARPGLVTGILLAISRAAGETAPLLFATTVVQATTFDPSARMNALPTQIFQNLASSSDPAQISRAWGGALVLLAMILVLNLFARLYSRRSRLR